MQSLVLQSFPGSEGTGVSFSSSARLSLFLIRSAKQQVESSVDKVLVVGREFQQRGG